MLRTGQLRCAPPRRRDLARRRGPRYRGPWRLPGPDPHRLAAVSLSLGYTVAPSLRSHRRPSYWTHIPRESAALVDHDRTRPGPPSAPDLLVVRSAGHGRQQDPGPRPGIHAWTAPAGRPGQRYAGWSGGLRRCAAKRADSSIGYGPVPSPPMRRGRPTRGGRGETAAANSCSTAGRDGGRRAGTRTLRTRPP
jgi:hypothetical protein